MCLTAFSVAGTIDVFEPRGLLVRLEVPDGGMGHEEVGDAAVKSWGGCQGVRVPVGMGR